MLDPQARALLDLIEASGLPAIHTLDASEARHVYRERRTYSQPEPPAVAEVRELAADGPAGAIPLRLFRPQGPQAGHRLPALVYYHGGGWTIGDLDTHDTLCRQLANASRCTVISVDYRMGPEHRFPAAVDDCVAATRWVHAHAGELGIDATRLAVGGDSAGGNLAAVVAIAARDTGDLPIAFQLLIYPATDMRRIAASHETNGKGYLLERTTIDWFHDHYIADPAQDLDWRASPLLREDLAGLPPALVLTAGYDPLRDEGLQYSARLADAGARVSHVCFERQIHGFITMGRVIDEANTAVSFCAAALQRALGG
ncbi:MAG: alpha/beta hydrolase [Limnobacter sp.]|nr:alpha/beta hydrolase [Limnobacter sp.]